MKKIRNVIAFLVAAVALVFTGGQVSAQTVDSGQGGAATITIQNAQVGKTYKLYKLFDATVGANNAIAYTLPSGKTASDVSEYFDVDTAGNVTAKSTTTQSVVGSDDFKTWAKTFVGGTSATPTASATASENTLSFTGLTYGYYFVESSLGTVLTIDSTTPDVNVIDKNTSAPSTPTGGGKTVTTALDTNVKKSTAAIGDTVNYTVSFSATNYYVSNNVGKKITSYTIVDTPVNLDINSENVAVTVNGTAVTQKTVTKDSATGKLTVVLPWVDATTGDSLYSTPAEVVLTYSATVKPGAATTDSLSGKATNKADITYNYGDNSNTITTNEAEVDTLGFAIRKIDSSNALLSGAEFKVYDAATGGNEIKFVKIAEGYYRLATSDETSSAVDVIPAGAAFVNGLDKGTYYLEEVKAPAGYNKLTERKSVTVEADGARADVVNQKGTELPSTGSFGTKMLYVVGAAAILVASVYMVAKRRVKNL
ncbi:SpaA isopeptide-forming pilin-related protein [Streptococcus equinus]|uniref:SpaA isopeptide-forming pilin-related protein n=1 Tax=Streptococcus equinus TaxID=1335 RepID=UPI003BF81C0F